MVEGRGGFVPDQERRGREEKFERQCLSLSDEVKELLSSPDALFDLPLSSFLLGDDLLHAQEADDEERVGLVPGRCQGEEFDGDIEKDERKKETEKRQKLRSKYLGELFVGHLHE